MSKGSRRFRLARFKFKYGKKSVFQTEKCTIELEKKSKEVDNSIKVQYKASIERLQKELEKLKRYRKHTKVSQSRQLDKFTSDHLKKW